MQLKHLLTAVAVSSVLAPAAMAKDTGGLRTKNVSSKSHFAGKAKITVDEKAPEPKPAKKIRKSSKRGKKHRNED